MADYERMSDERVYQRVAKLLGIRPIAVASRDFTYRGHMLDFSRRVLEVMVDRGWVITQVTDHEDSTVLCIHQESRHGAEASHASLDRAICVAALMALEAEHE